MRVTSQLVLGLLLALSPQDQESALPDVKSFSRDVPKVIFATLTAAEMMDDKTIQFDAEALRGYTYTETETSTTLDSKGNVKKTQGDVFEVVRGPEDWQLYRRQISRNGIPLTARELQQQDREQRKREQKQRQQIEKAAEERARKPKPEPDQAARDKEYDDLIRLFFDLYDIQLTRREVIGEHPSVLLTFKPKLGFKTNDNTLNLLHHVSLRAWITEKEHEVVKLECTLLEPISFGLVLAKFQTGSTLLIERQKIKDGIWTTSKLDATVRGRLLFLKGINERDVIEYSDFKEYSVETILKVGEGH